MAITPATVSHPTPEAHAETSEAIAGRLRLSATRLARRLRQEAQTGLSPSQLSALAAVERHGPLTLGALADHETVAPPTITRVVAKLQADGFLTRQPDPVDRRVTRVVVTSKGRALLGTSRRRKTEWLTTRLDDLDPDQRARLANALDTLDALHDRAPMKLKLRRAWTDTFRSLHVRNFRLFFSGQLISQIGNWLTMVALTLLVLKLTNDGVAIGFLAAAQFGPVLLIGPWAGLIADRSDKRKLLIIVQSIAMAQSFALAALAFSGSPPLWAIYAVALVGGITVAFDNPARRAFVVEMVPEADMNNAVSLNSAAMTSSRVFGPALAGLLVITVGFGWAFLVDGLSYIAVLIGLSMMRTSELRPSPVAQRAKGQVRAGLRYARSVPDLWVPLVMMAVVGTFAYNFQTVFPLFVTRSLGGSDTTFTLLLSVVSIGALFGALATARRKTIDVRMVALTSLAFGAALTVMTFVPNAAVAFPVGLFVGLGSIVFLTASTAIVQIRSDPMMRGRVLALQAMVFLGSTPIGGPIVGWICQNIGPRYGVAIGAVAALGAGVWGLFKARSCSPAESIAATDAVKSVELAIADLDDDTSEADEECEPRPTARPATVAQGTRTVLPTS